MFKLILPLALVLILATACDAVAQTGNTGFGSGSQQVSDNETAEPQTTSKNASRQAGCDGLDTINKVVAAQESNPLRARQTYDTESMRGCLEGKVVGFQTLSGGRYSDMDKDDPGRLSVQVLVEEGRGFSISQSYPPSLIDAPEPVDQNGYPEGLTREEQNKWFDEQQAEYDLAWAEYEKAREAEFEKDTVYFNKWDDFALSVSKGDTVRAECSLFGRVPNTHQFRDRNLPAFDVDVWLHVGCHWIDD